MNDIILYLKFKLSNQKTLFVPRDNVIFHCISLNPTRTACAMEYILYFMATHACPACDICWKGSTGFTGNRHACAVSLELGCVNAT